MVRNNRQLQKRGTVMRESFIFYDSFLQAIEELEPDIQLEVYQAIARYSLKDELPELSGIAKAIFSLIKPQIDANNKRYENGKKGAGFGVLGGRPKKQKPQENPKETPNVNDNDNVNVNVNDNVLLLKKPDPFFDLKTKFQNEFKKVFNKTPYLQREGCYKILQLVEDFPDFWDLLPEALRKLQTLHFGDINYIPSASWLLKDDNFSKLMNGELDDMCETPQRSSKDIIEELERKKYEQV